MSHAHRHDPVVPRAMLGLAGLLVGATILGIATYRMAGLPPAASPIAERAATGITAVASRDLRFFDRPDGSVRIEDARAGGTITVLEPGSMSGFIRGAMRGLARDRMKHGAGPSAPFRLTAWANGQLSLTDTATGRNVELSGFGETNKAAFARLLK